MHDLPPAVLDRAGFDFDFFDRARLGDQKTAIDFPLFFRTGEHEVPRDRRISRFRRVQDGLRPAEEFGPLVPREPQKGLVAVEDDPRLPIGDADSFDGFIEKPVIVLGPLLFGRAIDRGIAFRAGLADPFEGPLQFFVLEFQFDLADLRFAKDTLHFPQIHRIRHGGDSLLQQRFRATTHGGGLERFDLILDHVGISCHVRTSDFAGTVQVVEIVRLELLTRIIHERQ